MAHLGRQIASHLAPFKQIVHDDSVLDAAAVKSYHNHDDNIESIVDTTLFRKCFPK
jgi:hypothetical protein